MPASLQKVSALTKPYLFQNDTVLTDLPESDLQLLRNSAKPQSGKRGELLFHAGGYPKGVFWLKSGKVKIFQESPNGIRQTIYIYSDGDMIGFRQLIAGEAHPVSAMLLENSHYTLIPADLFRQLINSSNVFARTMLTALAREFNVWVNRMTVYTTYPVLDRVILALLILSEQYRQSGSPPGTITITRTELAEFVGASLETVVRALNKLKADDLVTIAGRKIEIKNLGKLAGMIS